MEKVSWKDIGLVNTREMFKKAMTGKYAIPAYNFNNMEQLQAIVLDALNPNRLSSFRFRAARANTPTRPSSVSWQWVRSL